MKHKLLSVLLLTAFLVSCSDESDFLDVKEETLIFESVESFKTIEITTNNDWAATSSESWLNVYPTSGKAGNATIKLTALSNDTYEDRNASVSIVSQDLSHLISVTQQQKRGIIINDTIFKIDSNGGTINVPISTNVEYSVQYLSGYTPWLHLVSTKSLSKHILCLKIDRNNTYEDRSAVLSVGNENCSQTITITQLQKKEIIINDTKYKVGYEGGIINIPFSANVDFWVNTSPEEIPWIHLISTKSLSEHSITLKIEENESIEQRVGDIVITDVDNNTTYVVTITQQAKPNLTLPVSTFFVSGNSQELNVKVNSNFKYNIVIPTEIAWISTTATNSLQQESILLNITKNMSKNTRTAEVLFTDSMGYAYDTLSVSQDIIERIDLNSYSQQITTEESFKIIPNVYVNKKEYKLNWKSSNTSIATVSEDGLVKAISKGGATITVTIEGTSICATCFINVCNIEDLIIVRAQGQHLTQIGNVFELFFHSKVENLSSYDIIVKSASLIDEYGYVQQIKSGNYILWDKVLHYGVLNDNVLDKYSKWSVIYRVYITKQEKEITVSNNIDAHTWWSL